jgi:hypothetical protein
MGHCVTVLGGCNLSTFGYKCYMDVSFLGRKVMGWGCNVWVVVNSGRNVGGHSEKAP